MNRKQLGILIVLLVVLGAAGWLLQHGHNSLSSGESTGKPLLGENVPLSNIVQITIKQDTNELNLVTKDETWRVRERNDYPANFSAISELVKKAAGLKAVESDQVVASQLARFQLAPAGQGTNSGTLLDFKDKGGKSIRSLTLGKPHMKKPGPQQRSQFADSEGYPDGRWVMVAGDTQDVFLVGDPLESVDARPGPWLNKDFFKIERPKSVSVTYEAATNSWKLARDTESGEWKLADMQAGEALDTNKIYGLTAPFAAPTFNDVASLTTNALEHPAVITVETFDGFTCVVKANKRMGEESPLTVSVTADFPKERPAAKDEKPEEKDKADKAWKDRQKELEDKLKQAKTFENWVYLVPSWSLDQILKDRKDLLVEKKEEPKPDDKAATPATSADKKDDSKPADQPAAGVIKQ
jgi:hypothetical protein